MYFTFEKLIIKMLQKELWAEMSIVLLSDRLIIRVSLFSIID